jgi:tetratricopeptide (TPR) repeat protein
MGKFFQISIFSFAIFLFAACSTKVNKFPNRAFHSTTTKYNILFNGEQSFNEGIFKLHDTYVEDYDEILPIYVFPDEEKSKELFPEMSRAIEKASKAIQRHSMYIKKKERNAYIDDSYWLMGRAHLYKHEFSKALEVFNYMTIAYKKQDMGDRAQIAMAKTNIEMTKQDEAFTILQKMESKKDFSKIAASEFHSTYAKYYIIEKNYPLAITELKSAIENTKRKKDKARLTFIMAQLYETMDNKGMASATYDEVLALKPSFELSFQAKTKKALCSDAHKSMAEAEIELKKLLRKSPQGSTKSLIYIALAELEFKKGKSEQALSYLSDASKNATDDKTKKKIYLKSARYYFDTKNYLSAQMYFDSALKVMNKKDLQYDQVYGLRNNLTRLANNIEIITYEDSLQKLALLSEDQLKKKIEKIIEDQKKSKDAVAPPPTPVSTTNTQNSTWYFANETTRNFGYKEFKKIWGTRVSEDNWRRKVKSMNFTTFDDGMVESVKLSEEDLENATIEKYLENVPTTPEKLAASHGKKVNAYYDLGLIYMEDLKEPDLAVENFKVVVNKYDTSKHAPGSAYFMYTLCKEMRDEHCTEQAKNFILSEFPESEYAQVVKKPKLFY